jgi:hypothetical protein
MFKHTLTPTEIGNIGYPEVRVKLPLIAWNSEDLLNLNLKFTNRLFRLNAFVHRVEKEKQDPVFMLSGIPNSNCNRECTSNSLC